MTSPTSSSHNPLAETIANMSVTRTDRNNSDGRSSDDLLITPQEFLATSEGVVEPVTVTTRVRINSESYVDTSLTVEGTRQFTGALPEPVQQAIQEHVTVGALVAATAEFAMIGPVGRAAAAVGFVEHQVAIATVFAVVTAPVIQTAVDITIANNITNSDTNLGANAEASMSVTKPETSVSGSESYSTERGTPPPTPTKKAQRVCCISCVESGEAYITEAPMSVNAQGDALRTISKEKEFVVANATHHSINPNLTFTSVKTNEPSYLVISIVSVILIGRALVPYVQKLGSYLFPKKEDGKHSKPEDVIGHPVLPFVPFLRDYFYGV